jgi:hypothetical protein
MNAIRDLENRLNGLMANLNANLNVQGVNAIKVNRDTAQNLGYNNKPNDEICFYHSRFPSPFTCYKDCIKFDPRIFTFYDSRSNKYFDLTKAPNSIINQATSRQNNKNRDSFNNHTRDPNNREANRNNLVPQVNYIPIAHQTLPQTTYLQPTNYMQPMNYIQQQPISNIQPQYVQPNNNFYNPQTNQLQNSQIQPTNLNQQQVNQNQSTAGQIINQNPSNPQINPF